MEIHIRLQIFNSHFKSVWKITKISTEKNRLWLNSGIIHSEKQPSNNVTSNETAQLTSLHILILFTQCQTWKMKLPFKKMVLRTWEKALPLHVSVENLQNVYWVASMWSGEIVQILWPSPKKMLLLKQSFPDQHKCVIHKNCFNKLARKPWEFYRWQKVDSKYWSWEEFFSKKMEIYWLKTRV